MQGNPLFPIFLKLDHIQTVIVGGGNVALEKVEGLLKNDERANITVIAPFIKDEIVRKEARYPNLAFEWREVRPSDLEYADLLILATNNRVLHEEYLRLARKKHLLVNVADTPDLCDFYLGSTVKKGDLKIGISTNGKSPTFAKRFREVLEDVLPDDSDALLQNLKSIRDRLKGNFSEKVRQLNNLTKTLVEDQKN